MAKTTIKGSAIFDDTVTGDDVNEDTLILSFIRDVDGDTKIQCEEAADEDTIRFDTAGSERAVITSAGSVGIGSASPDRKLDILDATAPQLRLTHTDNTNYVDLLSTDNGDFEITGSATNPNYKFVGTNGNVALLVQSDATEGDAQLGFSVDAGATLAFSIGVDDSDSDKFKIGSSLIDVDTSVTIDSSQNVGIGTTVPRSRLSLKGSFSRVLRSTNSNTTLTISDSTVLIDASGGNVTVTLPSASGITGRMYTVKRTDTTGSYTATLAVATGDALEGVTNDTASIAQGQALTVQCTGSGWVITAEYIAPLP